MNISRLTGLFDRLAATISKFSLLFIMGLGLCIDLFAVAFALYTPTKILSVAVAAAGCSLGTAIMALVLPKIADVRISEERKRLEKEVSQRLEVEAHLKRVAELEAEREKLEAQIDNHKRMRIDVNTYRPIFRLGLAEMDNETINYNHLPIGPVEEPVPFMPGRSIMTEYIGVYKYRFKAQLGIDMQKLRFRDLENGTLEISGVESQYQGKKDDAGEWLLAEVRTKKTGSKLLPDDYQVLVNDGRLVKFTKEQENVLMERINNGSHFKNIDDYIIKMSSEFLRLLLAPLGLPLKFESKANPDGYSFGDYFDRRNRKLNETISSLEQAKSSLQLEANTYTVQRSKDL